MSDQLLASGQVIEDMGDGAYRIELPNGHHCVGRADKNTAPLPTGAAVQISFHPYDLSRGRILQTPTA